MQASRGNELKSPYLICFICQEFADCPKMCPKCIKSFCSNCLQPNYSPLRQECPSCSGKVREQQFLQPCTILPLINHIVDRVKRQIKRGQEREQCAQHQLPVSYYCTECCHPLCGDCGLLTAKHIGHKFVSYRDIYQRIKKRVFDQFPRFDKKLKNLEDRKERFRGKLQSMYDDYKRYKKQFEEAYIHYTQKIQNKGKECQEIVKLKQDANLKRLDQLEYLRDNIYQEMEKKAQISLIRQTSSLVESISALACQQPPMLAFDKLQDTDQLIELMPDYQTWTYKLQSYSTRNGIVYSQGKIINGVEWRLKIYPRGNGLARQKYLSLFVEMTKAIMGENKYQYKIELVNPVDPHLSVKREYCSTFQVGECWGYNQFEPLDQLELKQFVVDDCLIFHIGVRNRSFRSLVRDQGLFIGMLQNQLVERQRLQEESRPKKLRGVIDRPKQKRMSKQVKSPQKSQRVQQVNSGDLLQRQMKEQIQERSRACELIQQFLKKQTKKQQNSQI